MQTHWKQQSHWYRMKPFRYRNQSRCRNWPEEQRQSTIAQFWKMKLEKLRRRMLLFWRWARFTRQSWRRVKSQASSRRNQKTSLALQTLKSSKKWYLSRQTPCYRQWSLVRSSTTRHSGHIQSITGNSGACSRASMLVLCLSMCFSSLGQPIIAMRAQITIIPKRQCLNASWNPLQAAKLLMTYPIRKTLMLGYNNGNIVVLSLLLFRMTLPISLMIPLLSVFVARQPSETLSVIYERYSAASYAQLATARQRGVKCSLSREEVISQPMRWSTFSYHGRLQIAAMWGAQESQNQQFRQRRKQFFLPFFIAQSIGVFPKLSLRFLIPFSKHQCAAAISSAAMAQCSAVLLSASDLKTISLPLRCCASGTPMVQSRLSKGFPSISILRSMSGNTASRGTMFCFLVSSSMGSITSSSGCVGGCSEWG